MILVTQRNDSDPTPPIDLIVAAQNHLRQSPYRALRSVVCEHDQGAVFLRGNLSSYYLKQLAQETVGPLVGTMPVVNTIEVT